jgi:hypothetical protein
MSNKVENQIVYNSLNNKYLYSFPEQFFKSNGKTLKKGQAVIYKKEAYGKITNISNEGIVKVEFDKILLDYNKNLSSPNKNKFLVIVNENNNSNTNLNTNYHQPSSETNHELVIEKGNTVRRKRSNPLNIYRSEFIVNNLLKNSNGKKTVVLSGDKKKHLFSRQLIKPENLEIVRKGIKLGKTVMYNTKNPVNKYRGTFKVVDSAVSLLGKKMLKLSSGEYVLESQLKEVKESAPLSKNNLDKYKEKLKEEMTNEALAKIKAEETNPHDLKIGNNVMSKQSKGIFGNKRVHHIESIDNFGRLTFNNKTRHIFGNLMAKNYSKVNPHNPYNFKKGDVLRQIDEDALGQSYELTVINVNNSTGAVKMRGSDGKVITRNARKLYKV